MSERTEESVGYFLGRDFSASIRLYFQYWMWRRQLGYLLNPLIPLTDDMKVADIACGTGIWLIDLAKEAPHVQCDGFDISDAQFPHRNWIPRNVTLDTLDVLKPVPESLQGKYDVVHVGLVVLVVENGDPLPLLDNLLTLLKPGGYLQWEEADFGGIYSQSPGENVSCTAIERLRSKLQSLTLASGGNRYSWVRHLKERYEARQLAVLDNKILPISDDIALPWTLTHLMATVELIKHIDNPTGSATDWWKAYEEAAEEVQRGASIRMAMISVIGRKPLI
ncbi:MAG: hypothetical protein MMC33_003401 [Icmadophila ericetorum]|nr:hypothetical protein [Icmadophila ericetorum]